VAKYFSIKHRFPHFSVIAAVALNSTQIYILFVVNISLTNKQTVVTSNSPAPPVEVFIL